MRKLEERAAAEAWSRRRLGILGGWAWWSTRASSSLLMIILYGIIVYIYIYTHCMWIYCTYWWFMARSNGFGVCDGGLCDGLHIWTSAVPRHAAHVAHVAQLASGAPHKDPSFDTRGDTWDLHSSLQFPFSIEKGRWINDMKDSTNQTLGPLGVSDRTHYYSRTDTVLGRSGGVLIFAWIFLLWSYRTAKEKAYHRSCSCSAQVQMSKFALWVQIFCALCLWDVPRSWPEESRKLPHWDFNAFQIRWLSGSFQLRNSWYTFVSKDMLPAQPDGKMWPVQFSLSFVQWNLKAVAEVKPVFSAAWSIFWLGFPLPTKVH